MTLCIAWIRRVGLAEELVFCTDSRLRSFGSWDANPKIFTFNRTDCAMCFSGDTAFSYPLMIQLKNAIDANPKMGNRFQRLEVFKSNLVKTMNGLLGYKSNYEIPKVDFLFGGYCWFRNSFKVWSIQYDVAEKAFVAKRLTNGVWKKGDLPVFFAGDYVDHAKSELLKLLVSHENFTSGNRIDMEPFQVLCGMLQAQNREQVHHLIGGPPQILKVYKSLNRVPFAVKWEMNGAEETTLFGMPIRTLNRFPYPILEPSTLRISNSNSYATGV